MKHVNVIRLANGAFTISVAFPSQVTDEKPEEPRWNMLFPMGAVKYRSDFPEGIGLGREKLEKMASNFARAKSRYMGESGFGLPVTFTHVGGSMPNNHRAVEDRRAAGWIEAVEMRADGLWGLTRWTEEARLRIKKDEFRFLSPEFVLAYMDPDTGTGQGATLFGASLVNDPFLYELPRVAAARTTKGAAMDKLKLCKMMGISPETPDEEVEQMLAARFSAMTPAEHPAQTAMAKELETQKLELARTATEKAELQKAVDEAKAKLQEAESEKQKAKQQALETEAKAVCASLVADGRMLPAKAEKWVAFAVAHGIAQLKELMEDAKPIVPKGELGVGGSTSQGNKEEARRAFNAEADKLIEKGTSPEAAYRRVRMSNPELAKQVFG